MKQFKDYIIIKKVNAGGMAEVHQAIQTGILGVERLVALKRILPNFSNDEKLMKLFMREGKLALQLHHPNIVTTYDFGVENNTYYIAMEFIEGWELYSLMKLVEKSGDILPLAASIYIIQNVMKGLNYAHNLKDINGSSLHIIHRDISPSNIMIHIDGSIKLSDFGIAHASTGENFTLGNSLAGKLSYLSPEMAAGNIVDNRADIFSVGVIFLELITGEKLFYGNEFEILKKIREGYAEEFVINKKFPELLKIILLKSVATEREKRYSNSSEFLSDINDFIFKHLYQNVEDEFKKIISIFEPTIKPEKFNQKEVEIFLNNKIVDKKRDKIFLLTVLVVIVSLIVFLSTFIFFKSKKYVALNTKSNITDSSIVKIEEISSKIIKPVNKGKINVKRDFHKVKYGYLKKKSKKPIKFLKKINKKTVKNSKVVINEEKDNKNNVQIPLKPGYLSVISTPWAIVYINGKKIGNTPVLKYKFNPGKYELILFSPSNGIRKQFQININSNETQIKKVSMEE